MDKQLFDEVTRALAQPRPRRGLLAGIAALAAASQRPGAGLTAGDGAAKGNERCRGGKHRCGQRCVNLGTSAKHCGSCGTRCASGEVCRAGVCVVKECGTGADCLAFVISQDYLSNGDVGGRGGADARCQAAADAASLPGTYRAWLSDTTGSPTTRFTRNPGRYVRVDGAVIAKNWAELTSGKLRQPLNINEQGTTSANYAMTATKADGKAAPTGTLSSYCGNWTDASTQQVLVGLPAATNSAWTLATGGFTCQNIFALYCFQQNG